MTRQLIPPVPLGEDVESTAFQQWMEYVRKAINEPPVFQSTINPTAADIPSGTWIVWKNTSLGQVRIWTNDGGVLKSVTLT